MDANYDKDAGGNDMKIVTIMTVKVMMIENTEHDNHNDDVAKKSDSKQHFKMLQRLILLKQENNF